MEFNLKFSKFIMFIGLVCSISCVNAQSIVLDPMLLDSSAEANSQLFERILSVENEEERYASITSYIDTYGPWVTLAGRDMVARIHVVSYLLQKRMDSTASLLLKNNIVDGWLSYRFNNGVANDFLFSLEGGNLSYIVSLFEYSPSGINTPFVVNLKGDKVTPLAVIASKKLTDIPNYESVLLALLDAGADPHKKSPSGLSPMLIASSANNVDFVRISQSFISNQDSTVKGLLSNTPLGSSEMLEMQAVADALIEREMADDANNYDQQKLHGLWIQMIIKGYNVPADLIYDLLKKQPGFSIDYKSDDGINGIMASTLSELYGGNVEYAKKLINRGAQASQLISVSEGDDEVKINLIQLALQKDNYKIVALLVSNNVNFVTLPDNDEIFILSQALEQKSFKSAFILKEALSVYLEE